VARATQASDPSALRDGFESVGKWRLERSGKYPVNKNAEEILPGSRTTMGQRALAIHSSFRGAACRIRGK
jgi:hypothetical protein